MRRFYRLLPHNPDGTLAQVIEYLMNGFDFAVFWSGKPLSHGIPATVRLFLSSGIDADYITNPLSWPICSDRFVDILTRRASKNFQVFDAPLFDSKTGLPIIGYKIVNVNRLVACLDIENSKLSWAKDRPSEIYVVYTIAIDSTKVDKSIHLFRLKEWPYPLIISEELANDLVGKGLHGLALKNCRTTR
jgi:hypothetical protein